MGKKEKDNEFNREYDYISSDRIDNHFVFNDNCENENRG